MKHVGATFIYLIKLFQGHSSRLMLSFLLVALIPLGLVVYINSNATRDALENEAYRALYAAASHTSLRLDNFIDNNLKMLETEARLRDFTGYLQLPATQASLYLSDRVRPLLRSLMQKDPTFIDSYALLDISGRSVVDTDRRRQGQDFSSRAFFQKALESGLPSVSNVEFEKNDQALLFFSSPVFDAKGRILGVLLARYSAAILHQLLIQDTGLVGSRSFAMLTNEHSLLLGYGLYPYVGVRDLLYQPIFKISDSRTSDLRARQLLPATVESEGLMQFAELSTRLESVNRAHPFFIAQLPGAGGSQDDYAAAMVELHSVPWQILFFQPSSVFNGPAREQLYQSVYPALGLALMIVVTALGWAYWLSRPLKDLTETAQRIADGDLSAKSRMALNSGQEIGVLARSFDQMTAQLRRRIDLEALISDISRQFVALESPSIEETVNAVLKQLSTYLGADRAFVMQVDAEDRSRLIMTGYWCCSETNAGADSASPAALEILEHPSLYTLFKRGEQLRFATLTEAPLPEDEKGFWARRGAQAVLCSGLTAGHDFGGILGLEVMSKKRPWSESDCYLVRITAEILSRALEHRHIEEQKKILERQLQQSAKLEAVGTLAGGIAHDFNNLLQGISGYLQLLLFKKEEDDPDRETLIKAEAATTRAAALVRRMMAFSRKVDVERGAVGIDSVVMTTLDLLERTIPKMVEIELQLAPDLPQVMTDANQLEQIIVNLVNNSVDAMNGSGHLTISAQVVSLAAESAELPLAAGDYVKLSVTDTGSGMDEATKQRIFEPFFTTKEVGRGTGLGLATSYSIVKAHNGFIDCVSAPGEGTRFDIYLPVADATSVTVAGQEDPGELRRGDERILIVDDEETLRNLTKDFLENLGYQLETAESAEAALELCSREDHPYRLILMDLGMPGIGGEAGLAKLREIDRETPVLVASGYTGHRVSADPQAYGAQGFITKPYNLIRLSRVVRQLLDERAVKGEG